VVADERMLEPSGKLLQHGLRVAMVDRVEQLFQAAANNSVVHLRLT
jgi:hypothetical protein